MNQVEEVPGTQELVEEQNDDPDQFWGKLLSLNKIKMSSYNLKDSETTIGRNKPCTICIDDTRLSGVHCKLVFDTENQITKLTDLSTNGTFLGEQKIGKGKEIIIKTGDEIYILHKSKVVEQDVLGFAFFQSKDQQKSSIIQQKESEDQKKNDEKMRKLDELDEDFNCPICDDLIFQAVTLMPCLHNFCGSCFSDWMVKQKTCPTCRNDVEVVKQNATINNVIGKFLQANPQKKRPEAEYKMMEDNNKINRETIKFNEVKPVPTLIIKQLVQQKRGRASVVNPAKRVVDDYSADSDDGAQQPTDCIYCKKDGVGFKQCGLQQKHVKCEHCQRSFPDRELSQAENEKLHHKCQICNAIICNLVNDQCRKKKNAGTRQLFLLRNLPNYGVTEALFRSNKYEFQVMNEYLRKKKISPQVLLADFIKQFIEKGQFRYLLNNKITKVPQGQDELDIVLSPFTPICDRCGPDVWFQIVFRYRISILKELPQEVQNRGECWWGINCRTMQHNIDHAKNKNHMCEQTKN